jgi:hypothetical protein
MCERPAVSRPTHSLLYVHVVGLEPASCDGRELEHVPRRFRLLRVLPEDGHHAHLVNRVNQTGQVPRDHPAYRRIIDMGRDTVPYILEDLVQNGPDDWFWALTTITGENPIGPTRQWHVGQMELNPPPVQVPAEAPHRWADGGLVSDSERPTPETPAPRVIGTAVGGDGKTGYVFPLCPRSPAGG